MEEKKRNWNMRIKKKVEKSGKKRKEGKKTEI